VIKKLRYVFLMLAFIETLQAQEIHFSQISNNQFIINPANAGTCDGTLRIGANYRSQGAAISVPYKTFSAWAETHFEPQNFNRSTIGFGISLLSDEAGDGGLKTTAGYLTASFIKGFNKENTFKASLGFSVGVMNRSIDFSRLVFDNQWNGTVFDPNVASGEPFTDNSIFSPDFNFGGSIFWEVNEDSKFNLGAALHHINRPKLTFYKSENRVEQKLVLHAMAKQNIGENYQLIPGIYFANQQGVNEILAGTNFLIIQNEMKFITGLWYRFERDIIPHAGIMINGFIAEFSYDINVSKLHIASNYRGGIEISIVKTISVNNGRTKCYGF